MTKKILAIFGATGQQGGSVLDFVANDPELSGEYAIRAITRDVTSSSAKALTSKAEVVAADISDRESLLKAFSGVNAAFVMTTIFLGPTAVEDEVNAVRRIADAAVESHVEFLIYSTNPPVAKISGGKYTSLTPFDAKAEAQEYISTLPIHSAFYSPSSFMENFLPNPLMGPEKQDDGSWLFTRPHPSSVQYAHIATTADTGKAIGAMLADPASFYGKTFHAAHGLYSWDEAIRILSKVTGQTFKYKEVTPEEYRSIPKFLGDMMTDMHEYFRYYGYYGPDTLKMITEDGKLSRGRLTSLEDWAKQNVDAWKA